MVAPGPVICSPPEKSTSQHSPTSHAFMGQRPTAKVYLCSECTHAFQELMSLPLYQHQHTGNGQGCLSLLSFLLSLPPFCFLQWTSKSRIPHPQGTVAPSSLFECLSVLCTVDTHVRMDGHMHTPCVAVASHKRREHSSRTK